jgi:hypothetical protein
MTITDINSIDIFFIARPAAPKFIPAIGEIRIALIKAPIGAKIKDIFRKITVLSVAYISEPLIMEKVDTNGYIAKTFKASDAA